jgi:hypothetical protein
MSAWLWALDRADFINVDGWEHTTFDSILRDLTPTFLLKLPYLIVYLLTALVLTRLPDRGRGETSALLWLVNPAVILYGLLMGQNDGWAFLATAVALFLAVRSLENERTRFPLALAAVIVLGLGAAIKLTPILLVPPFALLLGRGLREKAMLAIGGFGVFGAIVLPFLWTPFFREHGLFGTQTGKASPEGLAVISALYAAFLLFLLAARLRWTRERDEFLLFFSFVAVHVAIYFLPGWNPQRSILMIGALAVACSLRRAFLLPYLLVTAYALVLALEHGNELGSALFAPVTERVLNLPPLSDVISPDPLKHVLFWLGALAWGIALVWLWRRRTEPLSLPQQWHFALAPLLLAGLIAYLVAVLAMSDGVRTSPFEAPAAPVVVPADGTLTFSFFSPRDDVRAIEFNVLRGGGEMQVTVENVERGVRLQRKLEVETGGNRVDLGYVEDAHRSLFVVSVTPERPLEVEMRAVPAELPVASASLDGVPVEGTAAFTLYVRPTRAALLSDISDRLRDEWKVVGVSLVVCLGGLAVVAVSSLSLPPAQSRST